MAKKTSHSQGTSSKAKSKKTGGVESSKTFKITNELGLHARAAAQFVKIANRFRSEVTVYRDSRQVNGKSIMGILMLAAAKGSQIEVTAIGDDATDAIEALGQLIENKFGEK